VIELFDQPAKSKPVLVSELGAGRRTPVPEAAVITAGTEPVAPPALNVTPKRAVLHCAVKVVLLAVIV
jgi:hypothetical protein